MYPVVPFEAMIVTVLVPPPDTEVVPEVVMIPVPERIQPFITIFLLLVKFTPSVEVKKSATERFVVCEQYHLQ